MSYIDVLYLGLLLVAFLGFAAALFYFWRRWSNRNPPTRLGHQEIDPATGGPVVPHGPFEALKRRRVGLGLS